MRKYLQKKNLTIFLFAILFITSCSTKQNNSGYSYGRENEKLCIKIKDDIHYTSLISKYKYIEAEIKDLKVSKKDGKLTNVNYLKKIDKMKTTFPREFTWIEATVKYYFKDQNRYVAEHYPALPDPLGIDTTIGLTSSINLNLNKFPEMKKILKQGDKINVLVTNQDESSGGFYYEVVKIKIDDQELTNSGYCTTQI